MQNINEVIGIVKGISYDGIINNREINFLHSWVDRNRHFAVSMYQKKLIKQIDVALEDKVLTELERSEILSTAQNILKFQKDEYASYIELNGIIEGIISDNEINKEEVLKLNEWFTLHNESMSDDEDVIRKEINKVLEDGVVISEEQKKLLKLLKEKIVLLEIDSKLKCLKNQIRERNNIGIELIGLLEKDNIMSYIHSRSESILRNALNSYTGTLITNSEIVVVSLSLIAMLNYDGSFYDSVRDVYSSLYDQFSEQKVEGLIRSILNRYRSKNDLSSRSRIINYPLRQSIVPRYFLPNFFEFVFDIYKLNFDCNLPEDLYDDFKFVFEGLKSNMRMLGDDLEVNVTKKKYKLIQTTKDLVIKENDLDPLIKLSVMVIQLIDKYMWNKEIRIQNPYLQYGYEKWVSTFKEKEKEGRKRTRSTNRPRWKPKICLQSDTVLLLPPIHKIEYQYNYYDIKIIVKNGEEQLFENKTPDIREIIGGYQIISEKIKIDKPLGKLRYFLMSKDEVIYDSDDQLYRDFIVFDQNGQELINNTDYRGTAIFCTKYCSPAASKDIFFKNDEYKLSSYQVQQGDAVFIDNKVFNFTSLIKPGIFGDKLKNFTIACLDTKKEYPVYKNIKYLIFEDEKIDCTYEISINNRSCALNDYYYTITSKSGLNRYVVYLNINKPNIYSIAINRFYGEKKINIGVFDFVYDPELSVDLNKLTDTTYEVSIKTGLLPDCIREGINLDFFDIDDIQIEYLKKRYAFRIPLGFSAYRISNNTWKPLSEDLWINDIKHDTFLNVYGLDFDSIAIYSSKGTFLEEISVKEKREVY